MLCQLGYYLKAKDKHSSFELQQCVFAHNSVGRQFELGLAGGSTLRLPLLNHVATVKLRIGWLGFSGLDHMSGVGASCQQGCFGSWRAQRSDCTGAKTDAARSLRPRL